MKDKQYYNIMFWLCFIALNVTSKTNYDWINVISHSVILITMVVYMVKSLRA